MNRDLAIVGMVCKTPGAENIEQFWEMLCAGREGLRALTAEEQQQSDIKTSKNTVYAGGFIEGIDRFDPDLFGYTTRDALFMDPQHRLFLQACWEALEISGNAGETARSVGVFASASHNSYLTNVLLKQDIAEQQHQSTLIGNASDCLATRVSYCLNLTGPSMTIQCGCSSSLVAVHQARLALLAKQCDAVLIGGISLAIPHHQGYTPMEGGFASADGHCRPFSSDAAGTVFSSGFGVIVLKRLAEAIDDGDHIYAIIKGSAINNDGADKASFTAPSVHGQANVIAKALRVADVPANTIQYIETHGTGTPIGDPIEIAALKLNFQSNLNASDAHITIGSVKANIGHLDVAAGIISLIKTSLMLQYKTMTPQIHFKHWNTQISAQHLPFQINKMAATWDTLNNLPRRAGVSAFGFGGTNAHVILEEMTASTDTVIAPTKLSTLIVLSAKSIPRLLDWIKCLHLFLETANDLSLPSLAYTLQVGRKQWPCRFSTRVTSMLELIQQLKQISVQDIVECKQSKAADLLTLSIEEIQASWLSGSIFNWQKAYPQKMPKCVLPAAPLQLESYWLTPLHDKKTSTSTLEKRHNQYEQWLYQSTWTEILVPTVDTPIPCAPILIVGETRHASLLLFVQYCKDLNLTYCLLEPRTQYNRIDASHYQLNFHDKLALSQLETQWKLTGFHPGCMVQWVDFSNDWQHIPDAMNSVLSLITQSKLLSSVQTLAFITSGMSELFYQNTNPNLSLMIAISRGIRQEFPHLQTNLIDMDVQDLPHQQLNNILRSLDCNLLDDLAVWRGGKCWVLSYQNTPPAPLEPRSYFKKGGIYLITGGLGNVASVHVNFLAEDYQATLVLLGRTPIPAEETWPQLIIEPTTPSHLKRKLQQLTAWRERGFSIVTYTADVTSLDEFRNACESIRLTLGQIDGIIHIAGAGSDMHYKMLTELTAEHSHALFLPKLRGIQVVHQMMEEFNIPNCLVVSSISSALAGIGLAAYAGSHNLLDAHIKKYYPTWRIMNWDAWNFHLQETIDPELGALGVGMNKLAITPSEGLEVLRTAFKQAHWHQLYVSTLDMVLRVQQWVKRQNKIKPEKAIKRFPRPALRSEYIMSSTHVQQQLIDIWESLVGVEPIGIHDNFFELGGDSLLSLELINQVQKKFHYACSVMDLFAAATIAKLAEKIRPNGIKQTNHTSTARDRAALRRTALKTLEK